MYKKILKFLVNIKSYTIFRYYKSYLRIGKTLSKLLKNGKSYYSIRNYKEIVITNKIIKVIQVI